MNYVLITDPQGRIHYKAPVQVEGLELIEAPHIDGKILTSVDPVTKEPQYVSIPKSDYDMLLERLELQELALIEVLELSLGGGF